MEFYSVISFFWKLMFKTHKEKVYQHPGETLWLHILSDTFKYAYTCIPLNNNANLSLNLKVIFISGMLFIISQLLKINVENAQDAIKKIR